MALYSLTESASYPFYADPPETEAGAMEPI